MKILYNRGSGVNDRIVAEAVEALRNGEIIIYPTDTLYALGCDATNNRAIERLCRIKGINPDKNLLSIVCSGLSQAANYARIDNRAFAILKEYLPGPFTFVLPSASTLPKAFKGRRQAGIRIPDNAVAVRLADELANPLMSSSAALCDNDNGLEQEAETVFQEYEDFADITIAIAEGTSGCEPSTVVDLTDSSSPEIIRQGKGKFIE